METDADDFIFALERYVEAKVKWDAKDRGWHDVEVAMKSLSEALTGLIDARAKEMGMKWFLVSTGPISFYEVEKEK